MFDGLLTYHTLFHVIPNPYSMVDACNEIINKNIIVIVLIK